MDGKDCGARFGYRLGDGLGAGTGPGEEYAGPVAFHYIIYIVAAAEEPVRVDVGVDHTGNFRSLRVADHAGHKDKKVKGYLERLAGKGVLGLDLEGAVDLLADLGDAASDEVDAVVFLGVDIEILVFLAEEAEVHVEAVDLGIGELLLHLDGLLDGGHAADFAALRVAGLEVAAKVSTQSYRN